MTTTYESEALASVHEMMEGLHESGAIDKRTMREFDDACVTEADSILLEENRASRERPSRFLR